MKKLVVLLFQLFFAASLIAQPQVEPLLQLVKSELEAAYESAGYAGGIFAIVLPDGSYGAVPIGYSDIENKHPMEKEQRMLGGSTGKVFVSALIMQLVEEGVLDLDLPVQAYLGKYDWYDRLQNAEQLTLRNLLRHSSGISRYVFQEQFLQDVASDPDRVWQPAELLAYVFDQEPLFAPGEDFAYSDTNYILAAMVVEEVTGRKMYKLVEDRILQPFGLERISPQVDREIDGLAIGYNGEEDPLFPGRTVEDGKYKYNLQFEWAGGGFVMNPQDLARAGKLIYEGEVFDKTLFKDFFDGVDAKRLGGQWGLGVHMMNTPRGPAYGHSGFFPGYITNMMYFPDYKVAISYQINTSDQKHSGLFSVMRKMVDRVLVKVGK